jgi:hypothetical protein
MFSFVSVLIISIFFSLQDQIQDHALYLVCLNSRLIFNSSVVCHDMSILKPQALSYCWAELPAFSLDYMLVLAKVRTVCAW